jgi:hypothetical protein
MDTKIKKLLALYKDKSITIEEKRSIAVKLVDMGVLEVDSGNLKGSVSYEKLISTLNILEQKYKEANRRYFEQIDTNFTLMNNSIKLKEKLHKSVIENHKFQRSIANYRLGIGVLLVITIISLFI